MGPGSGCAPGTQISLDRKWFFTEFVLQVPDLSFNGENLGQPQLGNFYFLSSAEHDQFRVRRRF
jgi:hypothetical protein